LGIDRKQVRHVARLARLALSEDEEEKYAVQLSAVLGYIEKLEQVDVSGVQPLAFAGDATAEEAASAWRADEALPGLSREQALAAAPGHDELAFLVPRILE
jgi:aspartyl-tRNA(Asn)/glutamyl-tRNA(Gln) amidotransferase subunit C